MSKFYIIATKHKFIKEDKMSLYYIIGSNKELKTKAKTFNYHELNVDYLKAFNKEYLDDKFHYIVDFNNSTGLGYDIRNINDFYSNQNKLFFVSFLNEVEQLLKSGYEISLYQFWENFQKCDIDENIIFKCKEISTNLDDFMEDYFKLEFNTKYSFVQNLTINN